MGEITTLPQHDLLLHRLAEARAQTDELFEIVRPEAFYDRPIPERHRIVFYLGHLEAFDANLLRSAIGGPAPFAPEFDKLFAFGIDPVNGGLPDDQPRDWPARDEVERYTRRLRGIVDEAITAAPARFGGRHGSISQLLHVAVEHRLLHAETLSYMLHQLPNGRKFPRANHSPTAPQVKPHMVEIPRGMATLGRKRSEEGFGWDNEFEEHAVHVPAFRIDAYNVTNRQFLHFVAEGGYGERAFWSEADWNWLQSSGTSHPAFWIPRGDRYLCRTMFDEIPLPLSWPVYVSHAEATAYARWARKELPSEAEWHRAANGTPSGAEREYPWGEDSPEASFGNFGFQRWDPAPVGASPAGSSAFGVADLAGNGWEWTRTVFKPFEGFEAFPFYPGYSADFFDGQHYVMKGGSARTAACLLRRSFRNWFQPRYPYVYASFRCVEH
jgi:gamma-glutamyl hercynylcysteine S-oxide synthase